MELEHEKFEAVKELASIHAQIAEGRAILASVEKDKDVFLKERSEELKEKLSQALSDSKNYVREINKYNDELVGYRRNTEEYVTSLRYLNELVDTIIREIEQGVEDIEKYAKEEKDSIQKAHQQIVSERKRIAAEDERLSTENKKLLKEQKLLEDRRGVLLRAVNRLKKKND